jgi:hypothetical protein
MASRHAPSAALKEDHLLRKVQATLAAKQDRRISVVEASKERAWQECRRKAEAAAAEKARQEQFELLLAAERAKAERQAILTSLDQDSERHRKLLVETAAEQHAARMEDSDSSAAAAAAVAKCRKSKVVVFRDTF